MFRWHQNSVIEVVNLFYILSIPPLAMLSVVLKILPINQEICIKKKKKKKKEIAKNKLIQLYYSY